MLKRTSGRNGFILFSITIGIFLLVSGCSSMSGTQTANYAPTGTAKPPIPDKLRVPKDGGPLLLQTYGKGVQIYDCPVSPTSTPKPHAILFKGDRGEGGLVAIHFAGPTWQAMDGSKVVGQVVAKAPAPDSKGVPWLLLKATPSGGSGLLSQVTYIQRLYTDGGQPPASGCSQANQQAQVLVEYSAQYLFYGPPAKQQ